MKLRNGFVSNSSSSSFILAVKKEVFDEVMCTLSERDAGIINNAFTPERIFGTDCMVITEVSDRDGNSYVNGKEWAELVEDSDADDEGDYEASEDEDVDEDGEEDDYDSADTAYTVVEAFKDALKEKDPNSLFMNDQSW